MLVQLSDQHIPSIVFVTLTILRNAGFVKREILFFLFQKALDPNKVPNTSGYTSREGSKPQTQRQIRKSENKKNCTVHEACRRSGFILAKNSRKQRDNQHPGASRKNNILP